MVVHTTPAGPSSSCSYPPQLDVTLHRKMPYRLWLHPTLIMILHRRGSDPRDACTQTVGAFVCRADTLQMRYRGIATLPPSRIQQTLFFGGGGVFARSGDLYLQWAEDSGWILI